MSSRDRRHHRYRIIGSLVNLECVAVFYAEVILSHRTLLPLLICSGQVWAEARRRATHISNFDHRLAATQAALGVHSHSDSEEKGAARDEHQSRGSSAAFGSFEVDQFQVADRKFLEAYVLLEEFLKELASVLQAKCNLQSLANSLQ